MPCCDVCDPLLLNATRPPPPDTKPCAATVKRGIINVDVVKALYEWRKKIMRRDFPNVCFESSGMLSNDHLDLLSSVGPISSEMLKRLLGENWAWYNEYGAELLTRLNELEIPAMKPKPKALKALKKRTVDDDTTEVASGTVSKRVKQTAPLLYTHTPATPAQATQLTEVPTQMPHPPTPVFYQPYQWQPYLSTQQSPYLPQQPIQQYPQPPTPSRTPSQPSPMRWVMYQPPASS